MVSCRAWRGHYLLDQILPFVQLSLDPATPPPPLGKWKMTLIFWQKGRQAQFLGKWKITNAGKPWFRTGEWKVHSA
jgi:hypothetical protein